MIPPGQKLRKAGAGYKHGVVVAPPPPPPGSTGAAIGKRLSFFLNQRFRFLNYIKDSLNLSKLYKVVS
jgi:hypothetical protein